MKRSTKGKKKVKQIKLNHYESKDSKQHYIYIHIYIYIYSFPKDCDPSTIHSEGRIWEVAIYAP